MCGRFVQKSERKIIIEEFYIGTFADDVFMSYNVAPGQNAGVIINDGENRYVMYRWGLVPSWAKDPQIGNRMINARAETVPQKPSFKAAFIQRRCLIPVDGFYEWKKEGNYKIPYFIFQKSERPFSLAGLWEQWSAENGALLNTFTIITTEANPVLKELHERMPVIIPKENRDLWLDRDNKDDDVLAGLLKASGESELSFHEVSRFVNSPNNNSPECIVSTAGRL
jgi:putative SOS response-associated peptidase YedK